MAYPQSALPVTVEIAPGADPSADPGAWSWVDITSSVRYSRRLGRHINIEHGAPVEAVRVDPSRCTMWLDNRSGDFSPRNPLGAYYGQLGRNTPLRVRIRRNANPYFETDVSSWTPVGGTFARSTAQAHEGSASGLLSPNGVSATAEVNCETVTAVPGGTYRASVWVRCAVARNVRLTLDWIGAGQVQQTFAVAANTWTMLEVSGTAPSGTTGAREFVSLDSTPPSSHTLHIDEAMVTVDRFSGFVSSWPLRWDKSGKDATVPIQADGVLRRLGQGTPPQRSPMRRSVGASGPVAYWPGEDGGQSAWAGSALPDHPVLTTSGTIAFTPVDQLAFADAGFPTFLAGTLSLIDLGDGGSLSATVPAGVTSATSSAWTVHVLARVDPTPGIDTVLAEWTTPYGTYERWQLVLATTTGGTTDVIAYNSAGTPTTVVSKAGVSTSLIAHTVGARQNGASIDVGLDYAPTTGAFGHTGSVAATLAGITSITVNPSGFVSETDMPVGHLAVWDQYGVPYQSSTKTDTYGEVVSGARLSYQDEAATDRLARLCDEEGVTLSAPAVSGDFVVRMGPQPAGTFTDLAYQCVDADQGVLYEAGFGIGYLPREHRYNRTVALALDFDAGHIAEPPEPADDDQQLRNRWEVSRSGGSSAVAEDRDSIAVVGPYEDSITVNHTDDTQLADHAAWRVHLGTASALRWPRIDLNLARATDLIDDWLACGIGSRVTADNPPGQVAGDDIDIIVEGYTETLGYKDWTVALNCSPAQPWTVGVLDDDELGKLDTAGSQLAAQFVAGTHTSMSVSTTAGPLWTTDAADFPFDIECGGVRLTVTNITGSSSPQTFTVTQTPVNGVIKTIPSGTAVSLWQPLVLAL